MIDIESFRNLCFSYFLRTMDDEEYQKFNKALLCGRKEYEEIFREGLEFFSLLTFTVPQLFPPAGWKKEILKAILKK